MFALKELNTKIDFTVDNFLHHHSVYVSGAISDEVIVLI